MSILRAKWTNSQIHYHHPSQCTNAVSLQSIVWLLTKKYIKKSVKNTILLFCMCYLCLRNLAWVNLIQKALSRQSNYYHKSIILQSWQISCCQWGPCQHSNDSRVCNFIHIWSYLTLLPRKVWINNWDHPRVTLETLRCWTGIRTCFISFL